jgi:hypothetical protein
MRWIVNGLLAGAVIGLAWSIPVFERVRHLDDSAVLPMDIIQQALVFLLCCLIWAVYLASVFVPWVGQCLVDILFSVRGGARMEAGSLKEEEKRETGKDEI